MNTGLVTWYWEMLIKSGAELPNIINQANGAVNGNMMAAEH
jgi:hypothetical protein